VIAPYCSEYLSEERVRHFWSCEDCGRQIKSDVDLRVTVSNLSERITA
jgi:PHP family Zn ribbon phosphoesterase